MDRLEISVLGPFRVIRGGKPITRFGADTARLLLAYLALHTQIPCRREVLAGLLWPDRPEAQALHNLREALRRLRKAIGDREADPPLLHVTRKSIQLDLQSDCWLDVYEFDERIAACQGHRHRRMEACYPCIRRLREAVDLYRGDLMAGFSLPSSPYEAWLVAERERLHRQVLEALCQLGVYHERRGEYRQVEYYARRQLELERWQEAAYRQSMRALTLSGQRGAALAQYETCRRVLVKELSVEPEMETTVLYERIRDGELDNLARVPPHNLPIPLTPFVGREKEMATILECLGDPDCRLLTLIGPGGIGKTRLALEAGTAYMGAFEHGVYLVSLAPLRSADAIVPTVAQAIGLAFYRGGEPRQQLLDYLRQKSMLLLLDNFEHLLDGAEMVSAVLRTAPDVSLLITSRERLNVHGETLFRVAGMDFPEEERGNRGFGLSGERHKEIVQVRYPDALYTEAPSRDVTQYSAVKLFLRAARRVQPGFEPAGDDLAHIARICSLVEGMPLGILLAAAWIPMLTPAEIAARISQGLDLLEIDLRDVPARQRSIHAVFDHSWNLLTEREQEVFRGLSVFCGGFTHQAAGQVTGASLRELMSLANKSLLYRPSTPSTTFRAGPSTTPRGTLGGHLRAGGRYEVHRLLRQYAAEKLDRAPAANVGVRDRHCAYYLAALQAWEADLKGPRQQSVLAEMDVEIENVRAAWDWAAEGGQVGRLEQALDGLCLFYEWRGRFQEGEAACRMGAQSLESIVASDPFAWTANRAAITGLQDARRILPKVLAWQSAFSYRLGRGEAADRLLQHSVALLGGLVLLGRDTRSEKAFVLLQRGRIALDADREQARLLCDQSLALYQALGDRWGMANALRASGMAAESVGAYDDAKQMLERSLALYQALGDQRGIASSIHGLGGVANRQGRLEQVERLLQQMITIHRENRDRAGVADGLHELAVALYFHGKFAEAQLPLEECRAICQDLGVRNLLAHSYTMLGAARAGLGQYEQARAWGRAGLALSREIGFRRGIGLSLLVLASMALVSEACAEACDLSQQSVAIYREMGHRHDLALALAILGMAACRLGDLDQAQQHLYEALQTSAAIEAFMPPLYALLAMSLLLANYGDLERAIEIYALASRCPHVSNSRLLEDVIGRHIVAFASTLPPDVVAAAQERGRARDPDATVRELLAGLC